jgi:hypothetical protein
MNVKAQVHQSFTNVPSRGTGRKVAYYCLYGLLGLREEGEVGEVIAG